MRTFAVGVALLAVGVLSGCGGTTDAGPPPAPATTPSTSATPPPPAMPDAARQHTKAGAVAFVKYYVAALDHAIESGDVMPVRRLTATSCRPCLKVVRQIQDIYQHGGHSVGGTWTVTQVRPAAHPQAGTALVYAVIRFSPQTLYRTSESGSIHFPGGRQLFNFELRYVNSWRVVSTTTAA